MTGDGSCSVPGAMGNGIRFKAQCDNSFSVFGATGNGICSDTADDGSYSAYGTAEMPSAPT